MITEQNESTDYVFTVIDYVFTVFKLRIYSLQTTYLQSESFEFALSTTNLQSNFAISKKPIFTGVAGYEM